MKYRRLFLFLNLVLFAGTASAQLPPLIHRIAPVDTAVDTVENIAAASVVSLDKEHGQAFAPSGSGLFLPGAPEFNTQPLTFELLVKIDSVKSYNILAAYEPKSSPQHWELFTMPSTGFITVYLPGNNPDHLRSTVSIADGSWHKVNLLFRDNKAVLTCDGQIAGSIPLNRSKTETSAKTPKETVFAIGSLVENSLSCSGAIDNLRLFGEDGQLLLSCDFEPLPDSTSTMSTNAKSENKLSPSMQKVCELYGIKPQELLYKIDGKIANKITGKDAGTSVPAAPAAAFTGIRSSLIERLFPTSGEAVEPMDFNKNPLNKPHKDVPLLVITEENLRQTIQRYQLVEIKPEEFRSGVLAYWGEMFVDLQNQISGKTVLPRGAAEQVYDKHSLILPEEKHPAQVVLRRCGALLNSLQKNETTLRLQHNWNILSEQFADKKESDWTTGDYAAVCALRRQIMFADPAANSLDKIMFLARANYAGSRLTNQYNSDRMGGHFATQNYGFNTIHGGGIFTIENWQAKTPVVKDLVKGRTITLGSETSGAENRLAGKQLDYGSFNCPRLDYDGETVYFAHNGSQEHRWLWTPDTAWHLFKMNINGSKITQLTDGAFNDFDPCPMPDGRIVFISERRGGFIRCFDESAWLRVTTYTLHSMKNNGSDIYPISFFETSEWQPSVDNNGMLVYTRWDYTDRENCLGSNFWTCFPDGRNPRAPHGNYPLPWHTLKQNPLNKINGVSVHDVSMPLKEMDDYDKSKPLTELVDDVNFLIGKKHGDHRFGNCPDAPSAMPMTEMQIKAIPDSHKYIFTAAPHHGETFGSLCILNLREKNDYHLNQVKRITPYAPFPESECSGRSQYRYGSPYPLNENTFLCNSWEELVLLDRFGNEELICEREILPIGYDSRLRLTEPVPVQQRKRPPVIPQQTAQGEDNTNKNQMAAVGIVNVNVSDMPLPKERPIKNVRVFQVFPKPNPWMNKPDIGYAPENTPRISLGTVPVEEDGSVFFEVPPKKQLLFQTLDANGAAVQTMRAVAFVHAGEQLVCTGCHEQTNETLPNSRNAKAFRRPPSKLKPETALSETGEPEPVSFYRTVKPVFEKNCIGCHQKQQAGPEKMDYASLKKYVFFFAGGMRGTMTTSGEAGGSRSIPDNIGAMNSRLGQVLLEESHKDVVSAEDRQRIFLWLDANAPRLGAFVAEEKQKNGELVMPVMDRE